MVMEVTLLSSPLMQRRRTMVAREIKTMVEWHPKGRKGRRYTCNKTGHYARECLNIRDSLRDDNNNNSRSNGRNSRFQGKRKAPSDRNGNGQPFKRSRNSRYDESNVVDNKRNDFILVFALSAASPPDTLDVWLIDSDASRHLTGYKEALFDLIRRILI